MNNKNQPMGYEIEFLGANNEPLAYCKAEISINGLPTSESPWQADENGRIVFPPSLVEQEGKELRIKVVFWNEQYPKTEHSEIPEFTWIKGKRLVRLRAYNIYEIKPRTIPNEKGEPETYKRPYHIVEQGDTWEVIEKEAGVNQYVLLWENGLDEATPLDTLISKKIYFPRRTRKETTSIRTTATQKTPNHESQKQGNKQITGNKNINDKTEPKLKPEPKVDKKQDSKVIEKNDKSKVLQKRSENNGKPVDIGVGSSKENGYYYNKTSGIFEGEVKDGVGDTERVFACTGKGKDDYENTQLLPTTHSEFRISANIVRHETKTAGLECICIAFTAKNRARREKKSIYKLLMSGYSSVPQNEKKEMSLNVKDKVSLDSRKGVILALLNEKDPTNGAEFWDGTDFLAWGLKNPSGKSHAKFRQYTKIIISKPLFEKYVSEQKKTYTSGKVRYNGNYYPIPAAVFTDPKNWDNEKFVYITGVKKPPSEGQLEATVVAGHTIFWRVVR